MPWDVRLMSSVDDWGWIRVKTCRVLRDRCSNRNEKSADGGSRGRIGKEQVCK